MLTIAGTATAFPLRLRLHYKAARAAGVRQEEHMSDWDFLHDMHNEGFSLEQIADAAACGYNPWEHGDWDNIEEFIDDEAGWDSGSEPKNPTTLELWELLDELVETARNYFEVTGRHLQFLESLASYTVKLNTESKGISLIHEAPMANWETISS